MPHIRTCPAFALFLVVALSAMPPIACGQGISSSATSFGIAGNPAASGRANLASIGPNGFANALQPFLGNCCANSFLPPVRLAPAPRPPFEAGHRHHRRDDDALMPVIVPVYIPYAIGYEPEEAQRSSQQDDAAEDRYANGAPGRPGKIGENEDASEEDYADDEEAAAGQPEQPEEPEEPVRPQPATVLVFRDGHHADVVNYAIIGDALFDFAQDHARKIPLADLDLAGTEKANDALGIEFKLPPAVAPGYAQQ